MRLAIDVPITVAEVMTSTVRRYWYTQLDLAQLIPEHARYATEPWPRLTQARLRRGLTLLASRAHGHRLGRILRREHTGEDLDVLLQLSLFGEVVYG